MKKRNPNMICIVSDDEVVWDDLAEHEEDFEVLVVSDDEHDDLKSILVMSWISFSDEGVDDRGDDLRLAKTYNSVWIYLLKMLISELTKRYNFLAR
jgi:hypothetical protein